jgi:hypothetical protein
MSLLVSELHKIEAKNETETEAGSVSETDREVVAALLLRIGRAK